MREVALSKLLFVDVVVDIDRFAPYISPQLLYELARHASSSKMCCKPMPATMWAEVILHSI